MQIQNDGRSNSGKDGLIISFSGMEIFRLRRTDSDIEQLIELLNDCVSSGASVGFIPPLQEFEAREYWLSLNDDLAKGTRILLVAKSNDVIAGSVQVSFSLKKNGLHRGEIEKLMVHQKFRRQGLGKLLLSAIEKEAVAANRWLLVLDTRLGDVASNLYHSAGYIEAGKIPEFALSASGTYDATCYFYKKVEGSNA